jgi:hypothetical protein
MMVLSDAMGNAADPDASLAQAGDGLGGTLSICPPLSRWPSLGWHSGGAPRIRSSWSRSTITERIGATRPPLQEGLGSPFCRHSSRPIPTRGGPRCGNRGCKRAALSRCSRSLKAERISLIGETQFVVPQCCNLHLNRLIQWDTLGN